MAGLFKRFGKDAAAEHKDKDAPEGGKVCTRPSLPPAEI
jgi:hypothetical protein